MDEIFDKVKGGASKVFDEATKIAKQVADKTGVVVTQTKISFAIGETKSKMDEIYAEIGKKVYKKHTEGTDLCECMTDEFEKLDELQSELEDLNEKLAEVKETVKCKSCGENNPKTASYCVKCGESLKKDENAAEDGEVVEDSDVIIIKPEKPHENDENESSEEDA